MRIETFRMERMQSTYENLVECNLSESGVEPMRAEDLLKDESERRGLLQQKLGYSQSNGTEELREQIATFYPGAKKENIQVTNGGSEANYISFWSLLEPGDRAAVMLPNYLQTWGLARGYAKADPFRMIERPDGRGGRRWGLDIKGLRKAVTKRTRVVLVTNPNNPTGGVLDEEEMEAIVAAARAARAWLVVDEIYRGAELSGPTTPTFWGRYERTLITSGLSKAFGLPGLRIGWVVGPPAQVAKLWAYHDYTTIAPGMLSDLLARRAMTPSVREQIFTRTRGYVRRYWPIVEAFVRERSDFLSVIPPRAGAIALIKYDLPIASIPLVERLRVEKSTLVVAGDQTGIPKHLRIGFGYGADPAILHDGLGRIDAMMQSLRTGARRKVTAPGRAQPARRAG
ncbi:MAG TPA: aminotransferase class I/II-fold pyridoxal phosphate-dependent enzyme [Verrucomicrobiae bacterium]|nr:aminotransferase class I/II-fold pyridoxal phosphate-dependent enzyme [Verrucomicrobiae bacterium]